VPALAARGDGDSPHGCGDAMRTHRDGNARAHWIKPPLDGQRCRGGFPQGRLSRSHDQTAVRANE
jgi:hypothetical protein